MSGPTPPPSTRAGSGPPRAGHAVARFLRLAPALLAGTLCLRAWALAAGAPVQAWTAEALPLLAYALREDLLLLLRALPLLFLLSWPLLRLRRPAWRALSLGLLWSAWLALQTALEQYFLATRVPLGADLFGYSWDEIRTTVAGGATFDATSLAGWLLPPLALCAALMVLVRRAPSRAARPAATLLMLLLLPVLAAWAWPLPVPEQRFVSQDTYQLARNKTTCFVEDLLHQRLGDADLAIAGAGPIPAAVASDQPEVDPRYPFLHRDRTPDTLGPYFAPTRSGRPPHVVFILVEGLGRSFSGPDARLGSFTPFLDELGGRSLYWSNFLANQGRTFGVLPSVFGSLPFGEHGFAALGERMPPHAGLLGLLKRQGYRTRFYAGFDASFDNERAYLQAQGVDHIIDGDDYGAGYRRNPYSSWGYDDGELVARVLADAPAADAPPTVTVIQTMTMHTSYRFPGQAAYRRRFERRLDELGIADEDKAAYRQFADIYAAVLFTDDALRRYFDAVARQPGHADTIFVITGDHRLPELPMETRIERYHVPLLVYSPLLKQAARLRGVSSHLDIAPSLLAFLARNYGLQRPDQVAWTGEGLDMATHFRSQREVPLKLAKTVLADYVAGPWFLSHDRLYALHDGLQLDPSTDPQAMAHATQRFAAYRQANARFAQDPVLTPDGAEPRLVAYAADATATATATPARTPVAGNFGVREVHAPQSAATGPIAVTALFANDTAAPTGDVVPLLVLSQSDGRELAESYGAAFALAPGATREVRFAVDAAGLAPGRYFLAVIPSHPDTGRSLGSGRYRVPIRIGAE